MQKATPTSTARKRKAFKADPGSPGARPRSILKENKALEEAIETSVDKPPPTANEASDETAAQAGSSGSGGSGGEDPQLKGWKRVKYNIERHNGSKKQQSNSLGSSPELPSKPAKHDPDDYLHAKKQLKKAVIECYRYANSHDMFFLNEL